MSIEIKQQDVIRIILQFCKENGLHESFKTMQKETQIALNTVDAKDILIEDILNGRWDLVLKQIINLKIPSNVLMDLYEQIILELLELSENDTGLMILKKASHELRQEFPQRILRLDNMCKKGQYDSSNMFNYYNPSDTKEKRRKQIAEDINKIIEVAKPSRLLELLGQSLKYQEIQGIVKPNINLNLFTDQIQSVIIENDKFPSCIDKTLKYPDDSKINVAKFSSNGSFFVAGSSDGIIEVLDTVTGKLKKDLDYQNEEQFMIHLHSITSLVISGDNELLASGDVKGNIKVWRLSTGKCLKKFDSAHSALGVNAMLFGRDISHLITACKDIRVYGLKSSKIIKEFRGHTSSVNEMVIYDDINGMTTLVSCASDGLIKFWNYQSTECLMNFEPPSENPGQSIHIQNIIPVLKDKTQFLVCNKTNKLQIIRNNGQLIKKFGIDDKTVQFQYACVSPKRVYAYVMGNNNVLYCFNFKTGKLEHSLKVQEEKQSEILGIQHHPIINLIVAYFSDGSFQFLTP